MKIEYINGRHVLTQTYPNSTVTISGKERAGLLESFFEMMQYDKDHARNPEMDDEEIDVMTRDAKLGAI